MLDVGTCKVHRLPAIQYCGPAMAVAISPSASTRQLKHAYAVVVVVVLDAASCCCLGEAPLALLMYST
jgi:hypothetical protein